ncbi:MAG: FAD-binding oxidoreductase [Pseudonocardia sp.]|nr:FAD-binding oxidoreductase [Pseudonocardia sp.]
MLTTDVVIIGGGCVGTSVAFHLAEMGCTDVVLLESGTLGGGSTSKAAGGIRLQHSDALNARIVQRSLGEFTSFPELTGEAIDFKQVGYLFLLDSRGHLAAFRDAVAVQRSIGIPSELVGLDAVRDLVPTVFADDLLGAAYCPSDGYATPEAVVQGYAKAARRRGASIRVGCRATGIRTEGGRVVGVDTEADPIATPVVVCAAGVWSAEVAGWVGFELPVHGEARTMHYSGRDGGISDTAPLTIDFSSGFYFHREGRGLLFGGRQRELEDLSAPAVHRLPTLAELPIESSWWGYYDMSPDSNAMIGSAPVEGFHYATGFSGHGFQQSPAVGEHIAELVLGREPTLELGPLSADRFPSGHTRVESFII